MAAAPLRGYGLNWKQVAKHSFCCFRLSTAAIASISGLLPFPGEWLNAPRAVLETAMQGLFFELAQAADTSSVAIVIHATRWPLTVVA
jgi:hypothetical protein